jgi:hypothetical protein
VRTVTVLTLALLGVAACWIVAKAQFPCSSNEFLVRCGNTILSLILSIWLVLCGCSGALVGTILGVVETIKRRQWGWLVALALGLLAPLPVGMLLSGPSAHGFAVLALPPVLPLAAALLLMPLAALVYSFRYRPVVAPNRSLFDADSV